jgi:hypothetical protein
LMAVPEEPSPWADAAPTTQQIVARAASCSKTVRPQFTGPA